MTCATCGSQVSSSGRVDRALKRHEPVQCWICYRLQVSLRQDPDLKEGPESAEEARE